MFLKPAKPENGFKKYSKMSPEKINIQRKLETGKDKFSKIPDNTATGVDYLT